MPKELTTFDHVLVAIRQGHHAARSGWGANQHYIEGSFKTDAAGNKLCVGLVMHLNGVIGACGLNVNDLLADDWEIVEMP